MKKYLLLLLLMAAFLSCRKDTVLPQIQLAKPAPGNVVAAIGYIPPTSPTSHDGKIAGQIFFNTIAIGTPYEVPSFTTLITNGTVDMPAISIIQKIEYVVDDGNKLLSVNTSAVITYIGANNLTADAKGIYTIFPGHAGQPGQTENFKFSGTIIDPKPGQYRFRIVAIYCTNNDSDVRLLHNPAGLFPDTFCTSYVTVP